MDACDLADLWADTDAWSASSPSLAAQRFSCIVCSRERKAAEASLAARDTAMRALGEHVFNCVLWPSHYKTFILWMR